MAADLQTFDEAVAQFREFLRGHGVPGELIWIEPEDLLLTGPRRYFVRLFEYEGKDKLQVPRLRVSGASAGITTSSVNEARAREIFVSIMGTNTGVEFRVVGFAREGLCCCVVKRRGGRVKFSVPEECSRVEAVGVRSPFQWWLLRLKYRDDQQMREWVFGG